MKDKRSLWFAAAVAGTFIAVLIYEGLTPILSDDLTYCKAAHGAAGLWDLFAQEAEQYRNWTGRSVAHLLVRLFFYAFGMKRAVFNVVAALVYTAMMLLMYALVRRDSRDPDLRLYLLIALGFWFFGVKPGQTVYWETGACNYLFTTTLILGFMKLCMRTMTDSPGKHGNPALWTAALFLTGVLAGWCNENTSGAVVLFTAILLIVSKSALPLRIAAFAGAGGGFLMQLISPGNRVRSATIDEGHSGLMLYGARLLKILHQVHELFLPLLLVFLFLTLLAARQEVSRRHPGAVNAWLFFLLAAAGSGCLILAPSPQTRVFFGPGVFLVIACAQAAALVRWEELLLSVGRDFVLGAMLVIFLFSYFENGGNLARIHREMNARYLLAQEAILADERDEDGDLIIRLPMLPEGFDSPYTMAYEVDIGTKWYSFSNMQLAEFYGVSYVKGVPFDTWHADGEVQP